MTQPGWLDRVPRDSPGHPADRQSAQHRLSALLQHCRPRRQGRVPAAAEQRHAGHAWLARSLAGCRSVRAATSVRSAPSCCIPMAGCRRRAASSGTTGPAGISAGSIARTGPSTTTCARWTIVPPPRCWCRARCSTRWAGSTSAMRRPTARTATSPSGCASAATRCCISHARGSCTIEGVSHGRSLSGGLKSCQARNQRTFQERWLAVLSRQHLPNGEHVMRARDRARERESSW